MTKVFADNGGGSRKRVTHVHSSYLPLPLFGLALAGISLPLKSYVTTAPSDFILSGTIQKRKLGNTRGKVIVGSGVAGVFGEMPLSHTPL